MRIKIRNLEVSGRYVDAMWFRFRTVLKMEGSTIYIFSMHYQLISKQTLTKIIKNYLAEIHLKLVDAKQLRVLWNATLNPDGMEIKIALKGLQLLLELNLQ